MRNQLPQENVSAEIIHSTTFASVFLGELDLKVLSGSFLLEKIEKISESACLKYEDTTTVC